MGSSNNLLCFLLLLSDHPSCCSSPNHKIKMSASTKSTAAKEKTVTYLDMVIQAIQAVKDRKGASRAAIARWVQINHNKEGGSAFNAYLRTAITKGVESGVLKEGQTAQRFKIGVLPKVEKPKKKTASKKKSGSKKKGSSKKKTVATKGSKKKTASKKKTSSKKKTGSKKKVGSKKKSTK